MENEFDRIASRIMMDVQETTEEFIFKTIYPFSQTATQTIISKEFLVEALNKQNPAFVICGEGLELDKCPKCLQYVSTSCNYCPRCGQRLKRKDE